MMSIPKLYAYLFNVNFRIIQKVTIFLIGHVAAPAARPGVYYAHTLSCLAVLLTKAPKRRRLEWNRFLLESTTATLDLTRLPSPIRLT